MKPKKKYPVKAQCLRYVVPFYFGGDFDECLKKLEKSVIWKKGTESKAESDLFDYVRNETLFEEDSDCLHKDKIGYQWEMIKKNDIILHCYVKQSEKKLEEESEDYKLVKCKLSSAGLHLYRNRTGFLWYEITMNCFDTDLMMGFQNAIRELNHNSGIIIFEETKTEPEYGIVISQFKNYKGKIESSTYLKLFNFGTWIRDILVQIDGLEPHFFAARRSSFNSNTKLEKLVNEINILPCIKEKDENNRIHEKMGDKPIMFSGRSEIPGDKEKKDNMVEVPDKALLFSFYCLDNGRELKKNISKEDMELVFHLTNGYKETYLFSNQLEVEMKRPFANAIWFATKEGAAYFIWDKQEKKVDNNKSNSEKKKDNNSSEKGFASTGLLSKIKTDYFTLYLKALFQSYSLLFYAKELQDVVGNTIDCCNEKIPKIYEEVNCFLTKSMATSVSHIHHQSEFYIYLKQQLRIHEDIKSTVSGLKSLDLILREKAARKDADLKEKVLREEQRRSARTQAGVGLLSLTAISSAMLDTFDLISKFGGEGVTTWSGIINNKYLFVGEIVGETLCVAIGILAIIYVIKAFLETRKP